MKYDKVPYRNYEGSQQRKLQKLDSVLEKI